MRLMPIACALIASAVLAQEAAPRSDRRSAGATTSDLVASEPSQPERRSLVIPAGTKVALALKQSVSTKNARVGDPIYATTTFPVAINDRIAVPVGTYVQGVISEVRRGGRVHGTAELLVHFRTMIFPNGYTVALPGSLEGAPDSDTSKVKDKEGTLQADKKTGEKAGTVATTTGTGAVIGAISRGGKGAAIGSGIGAAAGLATVMLTRGNDVRLEAGSTINMVFERSVALDETKLASAR